MRAEDELSGGASPSVLLVPDGRDGLFAPWLDAWRRERDDCVRVDLGAWDSPRRNAWVTQLDHAIRAARSPAILCAQGLGCLAVAWWCELEGQPWAWPVAGALLVDPTDVARAGTAARGADFAPAPRRLLPFRSIVVSRRGEASRASETARLWGGEFIEASVENDIHDEPVSDRWSFGQALLDGLIGQAGLGLSLCTASASGLAGHSASAGFMARAPVAERGG